MASTKDILLRKLRGGEDLSGAERFRLTMVLSAPAILAQLSMCLMTYIDAAMVGHLGSTQAAAIGLVSTTTWIFGAFCYANNSGFSVQIAHRCGAADFDGARRIFRKGLAVLSCVSLLFAAAALMISGPLPQWLGGSENICTDARDYFRIYAAFLPVFQIAVFSEASLVASGNMKVPSLTSIAMCVLDVFFNYLLIFRAEMGVKGAALGTGLATLCNGIFLLIYAFRKSPELRQSAVALLRSGLSRARQRNIFISGPDFGQTGLYRHAWGITWPLWLQNIVSRGAYIAATVLIAPLGTVAIAANSFAIIAEGFCYLPGAGVQDAATTLVGQSLGAGRKDLARRFARITIASGASMMTLLAVAMYALAPQLIGLMSNDPAVIDLGARCLRIEAWAELLYGVSIVAYGCCIGAGDTMVPSMINLLSMWVVRIGLALALIPHFGLVGYWYAMAADLCCKGLIFAVRIRRGDWMKKQFTNENDKKH